MLGDLLGSVLVVVAAITISLTGFTRADSLATIAIFVLIIPRAWSLLREVVDVLLEATPRAVDLAVVDRQLVHGQQAERHDDDTSPEQQRPLQAVKPR